MMASKRLDVGAAVGALILCATLLLVGRGDFGIWDPWEVAQIEAARGDDPVAAPPLGGFLLEQSLARFGTSEAAGRLPAALGGLLALLLTFTLGARRGGLRFGAYAALVLCTTPFFLLHARTMVGQALAMAAQAGLGLCLFAAVFDRPDSAPMVEPTAEGQRRATLRATGWLALGALFALAATASGGLLNGALPPLVAVTVLALVDGRVLRAPRSAQDLSAIVISVVTVAATVGAALAVYQDASGYSAVTGGSPGAGTPTRTYEALIEQLLHGFAPWSALLLVALAQALEPRDEVEGPGAELTLSGARQRLSIFAVLWAAAGYASATVHAARLGAGPYLPVAALALLVAGLLVAIDESRQGFRMTATVAVLFTGLLLRDFELYPDRPLAGLGLADLTLSDALETKGPWALVLGLFAAGIVASIGVEPRPAPLALTAPYHFLAAQWRRGRADKAWLLLVGILLATCFIFGGLALVAAGPLRMSPLSEQIGTALFLIAVGLPVAVALGQALVFLLQRLGPFRLVPLLLAGIATGVYVGHVLLPAVGEQHSSRDVYNEWNDLRTHGDSLIVYGMRAGSGAFYAEGPLVEVKNTRDVAEQLAGGDPQWAAFPSGQLGAINAPFRERTGRHLFVVATDTPATSLVSAKPVAGRRNANPLLGVVLGATPAGIEHPTAIRFDDKVELAGYSLSTESPTLGRGQNVDITWYWRVLRRIPVDYDVFVHIDGPGGRVFGDHAPAGGQYPTTMWRAGDVIADTHRVHVAMHQSPGAYTAFVGLWRGATRMPITAGEADGDNRAIAGKLAIR